LSEYSTPMAMVVSFSTKRIESMGRILEFGIGCLVIITIEGVMNYEG